MRLYHILSQWCYYRLPLPGGFLLRPFFLHRYLSPKPEGNLGERLRACLVSLGPLFIKAGQMVSTRQDIFPKQITEPLSMLQDNVPPFSQDILEEKLKRAFGDWHHTFRSIDKTPLAAASVAQVHAAELHSGESVVIKLIRPEIKKQILKD